VSFAIRVPIPLHRAIAVIAGAALMVFVVGTAVFMVRDVQQKRAERRDLARQRAVRVLPAGAREAWVAYVHGRVAKAMTRTAQDVSLIQTGSGAQRIPFGTPFDVECDTMAGSGAGRPAAKSGGDRPVRPAVQDDCGRRAGNHGAPVQRPGTRMTP
jgi:hypothetical protein